MSTYKIDVIPDGAADPGPPTAKSHEVPVLRFAPAGVTVILKAKLFPQVSPIGIALFH